MSDSERGRGRPRSAAARSAILAAACALLEEGGIPAVTIEAVSQRAGVGKPTVYRHWANRYEVAMAALIDTVQDIAPDVQQGSPLEALRAQLRRVAKLFESRTGRSVALLLLAGEGETDLSKAFRYWFIDARRQEALALLEEAKATGEIRHCTDLQVTLDVIYGSILYRMAVAKQPIDGAFIDALVDTVLHGIEMRRGGPDRPARIAQS